MLALIIISFGILSRLVVHTPNFTPVLSMAFLGGMYLKGRQAFIVPLALMVISDCIIGFYSGMFFVWGSIVMISGLGLCLKEKKSYSIVLGGSALSSMLFFVVTNFGSWLSMYPHTIDGLRQCYMLAIPFFRSTLASTLAYSLVIFTVFKKYIPIREISCESRAVPLR